MERREEGLEQRAGSTFPNPGGVDVSLTRVPARGPTLQALGPAASPLLDGVLALLDDLYRTADAQAALQPHVTRCLRAAAGAIGLPRLFALLPLHLDHPGPPRPGETQRPWLLAVLRGAVAPGSTLAYVADTLLPLAHTLQGAAKAATARGAALEATQYHTLALQTWALLPGFCAAPIDLPTVRDDDKGVWVWLRPRSRA